MVGRYDGRRWSRWLFRVLFWTCSFPGLALAEGGDLPYVWDSPTVHVLWNDPYELYPASALDGMFEEVERLFRANGISVRAHHMLPGVDPRSFPEPRVLAVLHPIEPVDWNLGPDVMAAAVGERERGHTIFVFHPSVMRTLGQGVEEPARPLVELSLAMGRVVSHELVHVLVPKRGHAPSGIMARSLSRHTLTRPGATLDRRSSDSARAAIRELARSGHAAGNASIALSRAFWY